MTAIVSDRCASISTISMKNFDCGWACEGCYNLSKKGVNRNPRSFLKRWNGSIPRCIDRQTRDELMLIDIEDAAKFADKNLKDKFNDPDGTQLWDKARAQADYGKEMAKLANSMPKSTFKLKANNSAPRTKLFFSHVADIFEEFPLLQNSLVFHLLRALVYEEVNGRKIPIIEPN